MPNQMQKGTQYKKSFSFNSFHSPVKLVGGFTNVNHDTEWDSIEKKVFFSFNCFYNRKKFDGNLSDVNQNMERTVEKSSLFQVFT